MTLVSFFTIDRREVSVTDVLAQRPAFIIGSDPRGHLVLNEVEVAPAHASVITKQGQYFIEPRFPHLEIHVNGSGLKASLPCIPAMQSRLAEQFFILGKPNGSTLLPYDLFYPLYQRNPRQRRLHRARLLRYRFCQRLRKFTFHAKNNCLPADYPDL